MEHRNTIDYYRKTIVVGMPEWMKQVDWRAIERKIDKKCILPSRSLSEIRKELGIEESNSKTQIEVIEKKSNPIRREDYSFSSLGLLDDDRVMKAYIDSCIVPSRSLSEIRKELGIQENSKKKQLIR